MSSLRISDFSKESKYSVSKWMKHPVLLDFSEMEVLLNHLSPFTIYNVSEILPFNHLEVTKDQFLGSYKHYIEGIKSGNFLLSNYFSCALTATPLAVYACSVGPDKYLVKPLLPLIQMQQHRFFPSKAAGAFHSMVMSPGSIHWGIQFSYPQIFQRGNLFTKVSDPQQFPNTPLFTKLVQWLRTYTVPTTFIWEGKKIATPFRLGKQCFSWINTHPQLKEHGILVHVY
ncbi:MAG TPA: hypothetical protein PKW79_02450 [Rhabdochlamydiaceae bacterium]|nr:hypothetical protein [Rhabdochlamydiaceae bacterium]